MIFLTKVTDGQKQSTKKLKFSLLRSFFNFIKDSFDSSFANPCDTPILKKTFKTAKGKSWTILDRDAATYASRSGVPIEIVSKIILRHANLSSTQRYLGKVSDTEAIHWIDNLYR
jgi:hypothetical protein